MDFLKKLTDITKENSIEGEGWLTYRLRSLITGLVYHGQCKKAQFVIRMGLHKKAKPNKSGNYTKFYKAIRDQGADNWEVEITGFQENRQEADAAEIGFIDSDNSIENGYNSKLGGTCYPNSSDPEIAAKISAAKTGKKLKPFTDKHRANISAGQKGRTFTDKDRAALAALSAAQKGVPLSDKHRAALSASHTGVPLSDKHRAAVSAGKKGKPLSEKHCGAMSAARIGVPLSDKHCTAISVSLKGRKLSPESIAKRTATRKAKREAKKLLSGKT